MRPFFTEPKIRQAGLAVRHRYHFRRSTFELLFLSAIGFGSQIAAGLYPVRRNEMIFPTVSFAAAFAIVAIERPATTIYKVLLLEISILASQAIVLIDGTSKIGNEQLPAIMALLAALASIVVILRMPLRHPMLRHDDISPPFSPPSSEFRSPEDNFSFLQWATISWTAPLLSLANKQQLNTEDVWSLGYEFQHGVLHENFRKLPGTVFQRLMTANGQDIFITVVLGIIKTFVNFSFPILLQQILRSMREKAPPAATMKYATLVLVVEFIANQIDVFALWYQRRAYERSRGEMITMLYEKSLSRKVVSVSSKPKEGPEAANGNGIAELVSQGRLRRLVNYSLCCFRRKAKKDEVGEKAKELATTGKIMNLMRCGHSATL